MWSDGKLNDASSCWTPPLAFECSTGWFVHGWNDHGFFTLLQGNLIINIINHDDGREEEGGECFGVEV